jgi:maltooligosyltrehalose trehalohydrolase
MNLAVWAPLAKSVELVTPERRIALRAGADATVGAADSADARGVWRIQVDESLLARGYRYSIDGGNPIPDPRSAWQPDGVHGASRLVDASKPPAAASRRTPARGRPLRDAVIYEMHIGTFTPEGTYAAAQAKIPYLMDLGVTHLELMPLATFPGRRGWGYDGVDLYAPFPAYGTPAELAEFVQACHAQGLCVLLDVVYNHLGPDGNYLAQYGPYFTDRYETPWGAAVNYDGPHSDPVRRFIIDNALMWLRDYGFDGLRLDAVHAIFCFSAVHVLEELAIAVKELGDTLGRSFVLIAESDMNDPRLVRPATHGGFGLDAHWSDDFHHALHRFFTGETDGYYADFRGLEDVARVLREGYAYEGQFSPFRARRHGRPPTGVAPHQLIVSAQNHDQIGNRAVGDRLSMLLRVPQLKAVAALTLLSPFVPLLFQGEEWGAQTPFLYFTDHEDPELGRLVAEGRSKEFSSFRQQGVVPNPQDIETFERSKLDWSESAEPPHAELLDWYRRLIRLRHAAWGGMARTPSRRKPAVKFDANAGWLTVVRDGVLCVFNFTDASQRLPMPPGEWDLALRSDMKEGRPADQVPAQATLIYTRRPRRRARR